VSDLDALREITRQLSPPAYDDLVSVARTRRRRSVAAAAAAVAVVVVMAGIATADLRNDQSTTGPLHRPTPTQSPSPDEWTPERVRDLGTVGESMTATASGLSASQYSVCDGPRCQGNEGPSEAMHSALEVTQDGQSAVFDVHYEIYLWFSAFDDNSVLVQDGAEVGARRFRLLQADGSAVELELVDGAAPAAPGPGVVAIPSSPIIAGSDVLYAVDDRAGTIQRVDVPEAVRYWGPNSEEFLWGVTDDCRVFWATASSRDFRPLDCSDQLTSTSMPPADELPDGWLQPGRMVAEERFGPSDRTAIHVSLDGGATWQRIPTSGENATADVLRGLG
jgi:hypothetical protein